MTRLDRRGLIGASGLLLAMPALCRATSLGMRHDTLFPFGVASGDPDARSFVIWTRLGTLPLVPLAAPELASVVPVGWEVFSDEALRHRVLAGQAEARVENGYCVHVVADGLAPMRPYWYRFTAGGTQSRVGRGVTLPDAGARVAKLRVAVASCAHWECGYYAAYRRMAEENPDLVLFLGDYIYEHNAPARLKARLVRSYDAPEATDLAGYRWRYAVQKTDPSLQEAHAVAPWLPIWDDHEVEDDYSGVWSSRPDDRIGDFLQRRQAGYRAWCENMPIRPELARQGGDFRIYRRLAYGNLASIILLDGRQYRARQPCAPGTAGYDGRMISASCPDLADPGRTFLGMEQESWLFDHLKRRDAAWTVIAQDLMVASLRAPDRKAGGYRYWTDSWDGFQGARNRLTDALATLAPPSPVIFSGDYHAHFASEIRQRPHDMRSPVVATEFLGTSITSFGPSFQAITSILPDNPDIKFFDSRKRGYVIADFDAKAMTARLCSLVDASDPDSRVEAAATFVVERGHQKLMRV